MKIQITQSVSILCTLLVSFTIAPRLHAGTIAWSGAGVTDTNWSTGADWAGLAVPGAADDVQFLNAGSSVSAGSPNNFVDVSFAGTIGSLRYANQNGFHTTVVAPGKTLNITGAGSLAAGTLADVPVGITMQANITGAGGLLNLNNSSGNLVIQQNASGSGSPRAILDMSGLGTFTANVNRIAIGSSSLSISSGALASRLTGTLLLAKTNFISSAFTLPLAAYLSAGANNSLEMAKNAGNPGGICYLYLGQLNTIAIDSLAVGREKSSAWLGFNPAFTNMNPTAVFIGNSGGSSRVKWWAIGDMNTTGSTGGSTAGACDFSGGTVNA